MALPSIDIDSRRHCRAVGQAARVTTRNAADNSPAMAARPSVTNRGDSCGSAAVPVASRVAGSVTAKQAVPSTPSQNPAAWREGE